MDEYTFKQNKYSKWYFNIIANARVSSRSKKLSYYERHHIVPRSLSGSDLKTNLVLLTAREHFIVHLLLIKMVKTSDVYRMVHAIIRFTIKVTNSRQYETLRTIVSRYSSGEFNASFGKIWIHNKTTGEILYVLKTQFEQMNLNTFQKGLPVQRGGIQKGSKWITNGKEDTLCRSSNISRMLDQGWRFGRTKCPSLEHIKYMSSIRHTKQRDRKHAKMLSGRIQLHNSTTNQTRRVEEIQVPHLLEQGFKIISVPTKCSKACIINGVNYSTIAGAAKSLNMTVKDVTYRLKNKRPLWSLWSFV